VNQESLQFAVNIWQRSQPKISRGSGAVITKAREIPTRGCGARVKGSSRTSRYGRGATNCGAASSKGRPGRTVDCSTKSCKCEEEARRLENTTSRSMVFEVPSLRSAILATSKVSDVQQEFYGARKLGKLIFGEKTLRERPAEISSRRATMERFVAVFQTVEKFNQGLFLMTLIGPSKLFRPVRRTRVGTSILTSLDAGSGQRCRRHRYSTTYSRM
jgi:hypothetical protein